MNKSQIPLYRAEDTKTSRQTVSKMKEAAKEEKSQKAEIIYYAHV